MSIEHPAKNVYAVGTKVLRNILNKMPPRTRANSSPRRYMCLLQGPLLHWSLLSQSMAHSQPWRNSQLKTGNGLWMRACTPLHVCVVYTTIVCQYTKHIAYSHRRLKSLVELLQQEAQLMRAFCHTILHNSQMQLQQYNSGDFGEGTSASHMPSCFHEARRV